MNSSDKSREPCAGRINKRVPMTRRQRVVLGGLVFVLGVPAIGAQARPRAGDEFQLGDRVALRVEGDAQLTDTFTVTRGPTLLLPIIGNVSLAGVKRDSVEKVLAEAIGKYYRNPSVRARALVRVAVLGEVARPGFYALPTDMLVPDVVMAAGGPTPAAQIEGIRITRLGAELLPRDSIQNAIARGLSLSQIDVRSEDQFVIPRAADSERALRVISAWVTIPIAIASLILLARR
jgi:protein involved in polysaccharide export with SLBB domain